MGGCRCAYQGCDKTKDKNPEKHFFHYPVFDKKRCYQWIINSNRPDFFDLKVSQLKNRVICQKHFDDDMFMNHLKNKLKHDAVPKKLFPSNTSVDIDIAEDESKFFTSREKVATFSVPYNDFLTKLTCDTINDPRLTSTAAQKKVPMCNNAVEITFEPENKNADVKVLTQNNQSKNKIKVLSEKKVKVVPMKPKMMIPVSPTFDIVTKKHSADNVSNQKTNIKESNVHSKYVTMNKPPDNSTAKVITAKNINNMSDEPPPPVLLNSYSLAAQPIVCANVENAAPATNAQGECGTTFPIEIFIENNPHLHSAVSQEPTHNVTKSNPIPLYRKSGVQDFKNNLPFQTSQNKPAEISIQENNPHLQKPVPQELTYNIQEMQSTPQFAKAGSRRSQVPQESTYNIVESHPNSQFSKSVEIKGSKNMQKPVISIDVERIENNHQSGKTKQEQNIPVYSHGGPSSIIQPKSSRPDVSSQMPVSSPHRSKHFCRSPRKMSSLSAALLAKVNENSRDIAEIKRLLLEQARGPVKTPVPRIPVTRGAEDKKKRLFKEISEFISADLKNDLYEEMFLNYRTKRKRT